MEKLEELEKNGLFVGNKLLSNGDMVLATFNTNEEAIISSDNCCKTTQLAQINKLIEGFENNPKYYIEWEGKRAANGGCWVFGAQELINNIKKMLR